MDIKLERIATSYKMFVNDNSNHLFSATWWMKFGKSKGEIYDKNNTVIYKVAKRIEFLKFKMFYEIENLNNIKLKLEPCNGKHSIFKIEISNDIYTVKLHKGRTKSIFKNDIQIAFVEQPILSYLNQELIKIDADYDANLEIIFLIDFCLNIDNSDEDNGITLNLGNILKMEPKNSNWKPKNKHEA